MPVREPVDGPVERDGEYPPGDRRYDGPEERGGEYPPREPPVEGLLPAPGGSVPPRPKDGLLPPEGGLEPDVRGALEPMRLARLEERPPTRRLEELELDRAEAPTPWLPGARLVEVLPTRRPDEDLAPVRDPPKDPAEREDVDDRVVVPDLREMLGKLGERLEPRGAGDGVTRVRGVGAYTLDDEPLRGRAPVSPLDRPGNSGGALFRVESGKSCARVDLD